MRCRKCFNSREQSHKDSIQGHYCREQLMLFRETGMPKLEVLKVLQGWERQFWWTKSALGDYEYELKILCGSFVLNVFMIAVIYLFILFCQPQVMGIMLQVCHANPGERARFIRCIYNLLNSSSPAVRYEAAGTLVTLSSAPTAIRVSNSGWNGFLVGCCFCYWVTWLSLVGSWVFNSQEIHAQQRGSLPSLLVGVCSVDSFFSL